MTILEAIKILESKAECMRREASGTDKDCIYRNCDECELCYAQGTVGEQIEAFRTAIDALEKQIPKKPEKVIDKYCESLYTAYCPVCHWMLARGNYRTGYVDKIHKNCPECLQAIDWTEDE